MDISTMLKAAGVTPEAVNLMFPGVFSALACAVQAHELATSSNLLTSAAFNALKVAAAYGKDVDPATIGHLQGAAEEIGKAVDRFRDAARAGFPLSLLIEQWNEAQRQAAGRVPGVPHRASS